MEKINNIVARESALNPLFSLLTYLLHRSMDRFRIITTFNFQRVFSDPNSALQIG